LAETPENEKGTEEEKASARSEDQGTPAPRRPGSGRRTAGSPSRRRRRGPRSGDVFLLLIVFILAMLFFAYGDSIIYKLYSQTAGLILIIMVVEYLILKSTDRTRVYEMENLKLREQRRNDRNILKRARSLLADKLIQEEADSPPEEESLQRWRTRAGDLVDEIENRL